MLKKACMVQLYLFLLGHIVVDSPSGKNKLKGNVK